MVFKPAATFAKPGDSTGSQQGFAPIGAGNQYMDRTLSGGAVAPTTAPSALDYVQQVPWTPKRPLKGIMSWLRPSGAQSTQRGFPSPQNRGQRRPPGTLDAVAPQYGGPIPVTTPYFSRGAAETVQNYGKVLYNPIGAGVVALYTPQPSYGPAAQYDDGAIWWTSQVTPTTIPSQSLTDAQELSALLSDVEVQAVYRTTG
jgi:hypothetical protein